jgi:hypothetical protein
MSALLLEDVLEHPVNKASSATAAVQNGILIGDSPLECAREGA